MGFFQALIPVNMTALRIVRGSRILRVFKSLHEIAELLSILYKSFAQFSYVIALTVLMLFVYALLGMTLFGEIISGNDGGIHQETNFSTFYLSMMTLWIANTGDGWNHFMHDTSNVVGGIGIVFWLTFAIINMLIFFNIVVAVLFQKLEEKAQ